MPSVIEIQVNSIRDGEKANGVVAVERKQGDAWEREKVWDVRSEEPSAYRKIAIADDQRVVVEAKPNTREEYDREQGVVRQVPIEPPEPKEETESKNPANSATKPVKEEAKSKTPFQSTGSEPGAGQAPRGR